MAPPSWSLRANGAYDQRLERTGQLGQGGELDGRVQIEQRRDALL